MSSNFVITTDFIERCGQSFRRADLDHSGKLSFKEFSLSISINPFHVKKLWKLFRKYDFNRDGKIDFKEYVAFAAAVAGGTGDEIDEDLGTFLLIDEDQSGYISFREFYNFTFNTTHRAPDIKQLQTAFDLFDANKDGKLDIDEFRKMCEATRLNKTGNAEDKDRAMFMLIDRDNSGYISLDEFYEFLVLTNPGIKITMEEVKEYFKECDSSHDGRMNFEEFRIMSAKVTKK